VTLRTILVATDFSSQADLAFEAARDLARRCGARIELVHAFHIPPETAPYLTGPALERMESEARAELGSRRAAAQSGGIVCDARWLATPPAAAVAETAAKVGADLIAIGSHGHTGLRYALLGSVAAGVARQAPCPVLTVKQRPAQGWGIGRIALATDFSESAQRAVDRALELARIHGPVHFVLVHAHYVPPDLAAMLAEQGVSAPPPTDRAPEQLERLLARLQDAGFSAEYVTEAGHPAEVLRRVAERTKADLIALGTHGRRGLSRVLLGSVAEHVLRAAPGNVLTVGPPAKP
jgi:nucleotide-binding universal stress UspA family protein